VTPMVHSRLPGQCGRCLHLPDRANSCSGQWCHCYSDWRLPGRERLLGGAGQATLGTASVLNGNILSQTAVRDEHRLNAERKGAGADCGHAGCQQCYVQKHTCFGSSHTSSTAQKQQDNSGQFTVGKLPGDGPRIARIDFAKAGLAQ